MRCFIIGSGVGLFLICFLGTVEQVQGVLCLNCDKNCTQPTVCETTGFCYISPVDGHLERSCIQIESFSIGYSRHVPPCIFSARTLTSLPCYCKSDFCNAIFLPGDEGDFRGLQDEIHLYQDVYNTRRLGRGDPEAGDARNARNRPPTTQDAQNDWVTSAPERDAPSVGLRNPGPAFTVDPHARRQTLLLHRLETPEEKSAGVQDTDEDIGVGDNNVDTTKGSDARDSSTGSFMDPEAFKEAVRIGFRARNDPGRRKFDVSHLPSLIKVHECGAAFPMDVLSTLMPEYKGLCPDDFEYYDTFKGCYKIFREPLPHTNATERCKQAHPKATLMTLDSLDEYICVVNRLRFENGILDGWQGWWTSGIWNANIREFVWDAQTTGSSSHVISRFDQRWMTSLMVHPFKYTCVWLVPQTNFMFGNYFCRQQAGFVCEITL